MQFQVLVDMYIVQRPDFISGSLNGSVGTFRIRDCVESLFIRVQTLMVSFFDSNFYNS